MMASHTVTHTSVTKQFSHSLIPRPRPAFSHLQYRYILPGSPLSFGYFGLLGKPGKEATIKVCQHTSVTNKTVRISTNEDVILYIVCHSSANYDQGGPKCKSVLLFVLFFFFYRRTRAKRFLASWCQGKLCSVLTCTFAILVFLI